MLCQTKTGFVVSLDLKEGATQGPKAKYLIIVNQEETTYLKKEFFVKSNTPKEINDEFNKIVEEYGGFKDE